jgi:alkylation response protein AidB-like acyl-CoA dehydrogenase
MAYARRRESFGKPIWKHQAVANYLADLATKLTAARQLARYAAERYDSGERCDMEAGMAEIFASERNFRDAPLMIVGDGTHEIQRNVIAGQLVARGGI